MKQALRMSMILAVMAAITVLLVSGATPASAITPDDQLQLTCPVGPADVYWASYADYLAGRLTVNYKFTDVSPSQPVYNVTIESATATNGVIRETTMPVWMGDFGPGDSNTIAFKWIVPSGAASFRTNVSACYTCDSNVCVGEETDDGGINIKPGSCPNSVNLSNTGNIAVAVYSHGEFDATSIDVTTVRFNSTRDSGAQVQKDNQGKYKADAKDVNGDGRLDMVYHFYRQDPALDLLPGDTRACLSAVTDGGEQFRSCDSIRLL